MRQTRKASCTFVATLFLVSQLLVSVAKSQQPPTTPKALSTGEIEQLKTNASAGNIECQLQLGRAYDDGNGVPKDDNEAFKWYLAAAKQGNPAAENNLGTMYRSGRGVERDKEEAVRWYNQAAKQGNAAAMYNLGTAYYNGDGVPISDVQAYAWFLVAQDFGNQSAAEAVDRAERELPDYQKQDSWARAGDMYSEATLIPGNYSQAVKWYRKAAPNGNGQFLVKLAQFLMNSPSPDYGEILNLCETAANRYAPAGSYCVGLIYHDGLGVPRDFRKSMNWFSKGATAGHVLSLLKLGEMHWAGEGTTPNKIQGYAFVYLASNSNVTEAEQERSRMEHELTAKEIQKGQNKARDWATLNHVQVLTNKNSSTK